MKWIHTATAMALVCLIPGLSQAGFLEFGWQVTGSVSGSSSGPEQLAVPTGYGFAVTSIPTTPTMVSRVTLSDWSAASSTPYNAQFNVVATITDASSGQTGTLTVSGQAFTAMIAADSPGTGLSSGAMASAGINGLSPLPATMILGSNLYSMWIVPTASAAGSTSPIIANVDVTASPISSSTATPEPGALILALGGFPILGLLFRLRR